MADKPEHRPGRRALFTRCAFLYFALAAVFQIETLLIPPRQDSAAWLFMGARQAHGQMPGRDLWDNKLPLIQLVGRAAHESTSPQLFLWLLEAALTAAGALAVFALASEMVGRRGAVAAGGLLCIVAGLPAFHAGGFMTEVYAMPAAAVAAWLAYTAVARPPGLWRLVAAGFLWSLAVSFRLPLVLAAVGVSGVLALGLARRARDFATAGPSPAQCLLRFVMAQTAGGLLAGLVVFGHPILAGYLPECLGATVGWPLQIGRSRIPGPNSLTTLGRLADFGQDIAKLGWLHVAAVAGLIAARRHASPRAIATVAVWYAASLASAALGWASYAHYQYVALAPACLATAFWAPRLESTTGRRLSTAFLGVTTLVVVLMIGKSLFRHRHDATDPDRAAVVEFIREQSKPNDTVLVWAWSGSADLIYRINRPPGVRHFMAHSYLGMDIGLWAEMSSEFRADPLAWIVEDARFSRPALALDRPDPRAASVPALTEVRTFARKYYRRRAEFGRYVVLRFDPGATVGGRNAGLAQ